ncbi:hypothetical protein [Sphingorhabdus sp. Alg231-15]|uniref:hypothetical protein n=1 Tax=Sphingorhabdus sp. Alg231-15 TaxID=1922222 RepID=UPI000D558E40
MMAASALLSLMIAASVQAANAEGYHYDQYSASTDCGDRKPLTEKEQLGLSLAHDFFRIITMSGKQDEKNETAHWMVLGVEATPLTKAMEFPVERCASRAILQMSDGKEYRGLLEYQDTSGEIEHRGRAYRVLFEPGSPITELRYDYGGLRINGHLSYPEHGDKPRPFAGWSMSVER